jgi:2-haloacid dehalogenase
VPRIEGVIFDLGGVVVDWNPTHLYRKLFADEGAATDFLANICTPAWNEKQDAGRPLSEATAELLALHPKWEREIRAFYDRWIEMIGGPIPGTLQVIRDLKAAGVRLFALSNWSAETFPQVIDRFEAFALFEQIVVSGQHGCAKPDARFYAIALERFGLPPESLVFIDDNERNVAGAEAAGIRGLPFTNAGQLRRDLAALGVPLRAV